MRQWLFTLLIIFTAILSGLNWAKHALPTRKYVAWALNAAKDDFCLFCFARIVVASRQFMGSHGFLTRG